MLEPDRHSRKDTLELMPLTTVVFFGKVLVEGESEGRETADQITENKVEENETYWLSSLRYPVLVYFPNLVKEKQ